MRTPKDRIRHAISFEIIGLALVTPLGALVFDKPMNAIGVVAIVAATVATIWNYLYNLGFDMLMQHWRGHTRKTVPLRVVHAVLFEAGLLVALLPLERTGSGSVFRRVLSGLCLCLQLDL